VAKVSGLSLYAGVAAEANERQKLERLCRYITCPAIAEQRLSLTAQGWVRYQLKGPYRDSTTHVVLDPVDFIARLAALAPIPRVNLTRYHGVLALLCPLGATAHSVGRSRPVNGAGALVRNQSSNRLFYCSQMYTDSSLHQD